MGIRLEMPDEFSTMMRAYTADNNVTMETAIADTMEFLMLKTEAYADYRCVIESPRSYLTDAEALDNAAIRRLYMDIFGEDSVGGMVRCFYDPEIMDTLFLEIRYDTDVPVWNVLEAFHYRIPGMALQDDLLTMYFVHDRYQGQEEREALLSGWLDEDDSEIPEDSVTAGYYESVYEEPEEDYEDYEDDEDDEDDEDGEF